MKTEFALQLLTEYRGWVRQVRHFDRAIENYSMSTHSSREDIFTIAAKIRELAKRQGLYVRRLSFVRDALSKMKKRDRQCLIGYYVVKSDATEICQKINLSRSTFYRVKAQALEKFIAVCETMEETLGVALV